MSESNTNDKKAFDIVGFDAEKLDISDLIDLVLPLRKDFPSDVVAGKEWTIDPIHQTEARTIFRLVPDDPQAYPVLKVKFFHNQPDRAERADAVLRALYDFGVGIGPRSFYSTTKLKDLDEGLLICEWLEGEPLNQPPPVENEEMWRRIMAVMGVMKNMPFAKFSNQIPMEGRGIQQPADLFEWLERALANLDENHIDYDMLADLVAHVRAQVTKEWTAMPKVALSRLDVDLSHFLWDGHHLRGISWHNSDWADTAFDVAQLAADPVFEEVPSSHWVWFRWEYARLTHEENTIARATTYTRMMFVYWAIKLTRQIEEQTEDKTRNHLLKQRDRYLKRAQRYFS